MNEDKRLEILHHYKLSDSHIKNEEGVIWYADKGSIESTLKRFVSRYSENQQTIIDYDENYEFFIIRGIPKNYGDAEQPPKPKQMHPYIWQDHEGEFYSDDLKKWVAATSNKRQQEGRQGDEEE